MREVNDQRQKELLTQGLPVVHERMHGSVRLQLLHDLDAGVWFVHATAPSKGVDRLFRLEADERHDWEAVVRREV